MKTRKLAIAVTAITMGFVAAPALAQSVTTAGQWERPYGVRAGQESQPWSSANSSASASAASRSEAGNRVIIDGIIQTGVGVSSGTGQFGRGGVGSGATAIGNQLNVNVTGRYNTVIVNSDQINNGDINASATANGNVSTDNDQN